MMLADQIEEVVAKYDYVSFAELPRRLKRHDLKGEMALTLTARPNTILWMGMSDEYVEAMVGLFRAGRVHVHPSTYLVYLIDGAFPRMKIAKRPHKTKDYTTERWLPAVLRTVPL